MAHGGTIVSISVPVGYRAAPADDLRLSA